MSLLDHRFVTTSLVLKRKEISKIPCTIHELPFDWPLTLDWIMQDFISNSNYICAKAKGVR